MTTLTSNQTVEITWTDAPIIRMTARKAIEVCGMHINEGEIFFMVRSASQENRYHCVRWNYERICWQCSCGGGCKKHSHVKRVSAYSKVQPYSVTHPQGCPKVVKTEVPKVSENTCKVDKKQNTPCKGVSKTTDISCKGNISRGFQLMR